MSVRVASPARKLQLSPQLFELTALSGPLQETVQSSDLDADDGVSSDLGDVRIKEGDAGSREQQECSKSQRRKIIRPSFGGRR